MQNNFSVGTMESMNHLIVCIAILLISNFGFAQPGTYDLGTEEYPPYNFTDPKTGELRGQATEKVRDLMRIAGLPFKIQVAPWLRSYNRALSGPRRCVFSTARNEARESLFEWVGPLVTVEWVLFAKRGTPAAAVTTLNEAKKYTIGGVIGGAVVEELLADGYRIEGVHRAWLNQEKLLNQRIQLWLEDPEYIKFRTAVGSEAIPLIRTVVFKKRELYLACNLKTPQGELLRLRKALKELDSSNPSATSAPGKSK